MQEHLLRITEPLLDWFDENKRELPWRKDRHPYHVWISEIMLQQTRIEVVKQYYVTFMTEVPDVESLSAIGEDKLLKLWEGLGYYSRARNLKKAAEMVMRDYDGAFPNSFEQLKKLPGIGEYTAGAIASICYNEKVPAVDGNVLRVVARVLGDRKNVLLPETKKEVAEALKEIMPAQAGTFNEALMELGEIICFPNASPSCERCPLREICVACQNHLTSEIPVRIKNQTRRKENKTVLLLVTPNHETAIEKRTGKGLLSGLYQLPNVDGFRTEEELKTMVKEWGMRVENISFLKKAKHVFTHIDWNMKGYLVEVSEKADRFLWASPREILDVYPLPTAFQTFLKS